MSRPPAPNSGGAGPTPAEEPTPAFGRYAVMPQAYPSLLRRGEDSEGRGRRNKGAASSAPTLAPPSLTGKGAGGLGLLLALLLSGCGSDKPYSGPPPAPPAQAAPAPAPARHAARSDDLQDPLLGSGGGSGGGGNNGGGGGGLTAPPDPLLPPDPLQGRPMPTAHSHWLRGRLAGGRVTVLLNGARQPALSGVVDQDITMRLRSGVNRATFVFQPTTARASADLEIVESEHDPPLPPLAVFRVSPDAAQAAAPPTTRTVTFAAN